MEVNSLKSNELLDDLFDGLAVTDKDSNVIYWNKSAERLSGFGGRDIVGNKFCEKVLIFLDDNATPMEKTFNPVDLTLNDGQMRESDLFLSKSDGTKIPVSVKVTPVHNRAGKIIGAVQQLSDNTVKVELVSKVKELQRLAMFDSLTELGNRRFATRNLDAMFNEFKRYGHSFGILFFDIDHFKSINDAFGHDTGDKMLKIVADTLAGSVRSFDVISRWGGEEFVGLIKNIDKDNLLIVANKLCREVGESLLLEEGKEIGVTVSVGGTMARGSDNVDSLINRADKLMYRAKKSGRNQVLVN